MRTWTMVRMVAILALVINVASAHHPFSGVYDETKFGTLAGKVAAVQWTNPHVVFALDVETDGKTERWVVEGSAPNGLLRQGWSKDTLREGSRITVSGWHARDASLKIFSGHEVTFEDGVTRAFGAGPAADRWKCLSDNCPNWIPSITQ
jgi:hypothetical protein